jgi:hypothetical protein
MTPRYLPILKAKKGEFAALEKAKSRTRQDILPLFEVSKISGSVRSAKRFRNDPLITANYLNEVAQSIAAVWSGNVAMADVFQWKPDSATETGEHVLAYLYRQLSARGVRVVPVIGYDRWESAAYQLALKGLDVGDDGHYCLRLDSTALDDAQDPDFFEGRVVEILNALGVHPSNCAVLMDFGDVTAFSIEALVERSVDVLELLHAMNFKFIATSGCSLPSSIDQAVRTRDSTGTVMRKEMVLWQALRETYPSQNLVFGDYALRGPNTAEDIISTNTNGKIRHTIDKEYFIARGHSMSDPGKGKQMYKLAQKIIDSLHYMGEDFSWGDSRIAACSREEFTGNSTSWIAIDTSHHMEWVTAELREFERVHETTDRA